MSIFSTVGARPVKRSKFDLSHERKLSLNMGDLVPILVQEVIPGDVFRINTEMMLRMAPMVSPVMHRCDAWLHYYFVPKRLIWNEWEDFITGGRDGNAAPVLPYFRFDNTMRNWMTVNTLWDHMGLPIVPYNQAAIDVTPKINALPFRAYQFIYNEYYRDQNLSAENVFGLGSGEIVNATERQTLLTMRKRPWEKDYFTSALPWTQRGGEVGMPVEFNYMQQSDVLDINGNSVTGNLSTNGDGVLSVDVDGARVENLDENSTQFTINELRKAIRLQEWLEKSARGGARYIEQILHHFGVKSSDARLQRPEFLGGCKNPITISEVLSTVEVTDQLPQGNMSGHGISVGSSAVIHRNFEEHGYVIGIMSVLPRTAYQQGLDRMWSREDKFDFAWPEFAQLGEQEVKQKEVYTTFLNSNNPENTFGYQSRYAEYKYKPSTVHGDFRESLAHWHMGRIFSAPPVLNQSFISSDPTTRIFAVEDPQVPKLYCQLYHNFSALRKLPYMNVPTI